MAITIKDIREKEFKKDYRGYNMDEVDDFLEALAAQMDVLARENVALKNSLKDAQNELEAAKAETVAQAETDTEAKAEPALDAAPMANAPAVQESVNLPAFNEPSYFKNLETTLRETLISAQRIADETIDDARKKARKIVAEAEEQAGSIQEQSAAKMAEAKADYDALKNASEEYRRGFSELIEGQTKLLKESPLFN